MTLPKSSIQLYRANS